jgi:hypothetical protein
MSCKDRGTVYVPKDVIEYISKAEHESKIGELKRRYASIVEELKARRDENPDLIWHPKSKVFTYNGVIQDQF